MGGENTLLNESSARHLLRRAGFGAQPTDVDKFKILTRGAAADKLLNFTPSKFKPTGGGDFEKRQNSWIKYMLNIKSPLQEKLVLFWHDHFATNVTVVGDLDFIAVQNQRLRKFCKGNFKAFVKEMNQDPAMMWFLDTDDNHKDQPNENYARELQELFTLGVKDFNGVNNYTQQDIVQIARAFSGWSFDYRKIKSEFHDYDHDFNEDYEPDRGAKVIYTSTGGFGVDGKTFGDSTNPQIGEGAVEIDNVIDIIFQHQDTNGKNTVARRTCRRLLEYFVHGGYATVTPAVKGVVDDIVSKSGFDTSWDIGALVREILVHDAFYNDTSGPLSLPPYQPSVKWPTDLLVSTMRMLKVKSSIYRHFYVYVDGGDQASLRDLLRDMGQVLFDPPSVFGWDWEAAWLSSATLLARFDFARNIAAARGKGTKHFHAEKFVSLSENDLGDIVDSVTKVLGVFDRVSAGERQALIDYMTDGDGGPGSTPFPPNGLNDQDYRNRKLNGLFALVLESPAYQVH
jgi:uncharacterized protein (DUF1800 family)